MSFRCPCRCRRIRLTAFVLVLSIAVWPGHGATDVGDDDPPAPAAIEGTVVDASTGSPLPRANVVLVETQTGAATDERGRFRLDHIAAGEYTVVVTYVGYKPRHRTVRVEESEQLRLEIALTPSSSNPGEVSVSADRLSRHELETFGVSRVGSEDLTKIPSALESDVFRSLQKLPGVGASSDFSSGLYVRGGTPDQTLIRLNNATLYNPDHLLGFFSTFNPDVVDEVLLHKGAYPAEYGGRMGSVLEINHRGDRTESVTPRASVGLLASRATLEGPLQGGAWTASVRRSTMEPVLSELNARNVEGTPETFHFYDVNGSLNMPLSRSDRLELTLYSGFDDMRFPFSSNMLFDVAYGNQAASARWTHIMDDRFYSSVTAAVSRYASNSNALLSRSPLTRRSEIRDFSLEADFGFLPGRHHTIDGGLRLGYLGFGLEDVRASRTQLDRRRRTVQTDVYLQDSFRLTSRWTLRGGLRGSYFAAGDYLRLAPRFSITYSPLHDLRLQVAGGRYHQFLTLNTSQFISSFDAWLPAGEDIPPSYSDQIGAGLETNITSDVSLDIEVYYRTMNDLFELDPRRGDTSGRRYGELFQFGSGYAYGLEVMLKKSVGRFNGFAAYTHGKTRRRFSAVNGGRYYAPRHDRPHDASLVLNYLVADQWELSSTFTYTSGQPYTKPVGQYRLVDSPHHAHFENVFITSYNNARMPAYHRLDLGLTRRGELFDLAEYRARLQVINVYGRRNMWFYLYEFAGNQDVAETAVPQIPVPLPNLSFSLQF